MRLAWDAFATPVGRMYVAVDEDGALVQANFEGDDGASFLQDLEDLGDPTHNPKSLLHVREQIEEYFRGIRKRFELKVAFCRCTEFQRRVWEATLRIPYGSVATYKSIATKLGVPRAARAVGGALGQNRVCVVIPCHRVIASDGSMGGYSGYGGIETKRKLLKLEGAE